MDTLNHLLKIELLKDKYDTPYDLLLSADPSMENIKNYLELGSCYLAILDDEVIGVVVLKELNSTSIEIVNVAVKESFRSKGVGVKLLTFSEKVSKVFGYTSLIIATGNSSIRQLAIYQKFGFEIEETYRNYFLDNYSDLIFEDGIQCKHKIVLKKIL